MTAGEPSPAVATAALAATGLLSARRMCQLLTRHNGAQGAWSAMCGRSPSDVLDSWERQRPGVSANLHRRALSVDLAVCAERLAASGAQAIAFGDENYPAMLAADLDPPATLFVRGDLRLLARRRVGVIGTRNATEQGRRFAFHLGAELSRAGVAIVSGLARGIDGSVHKGTLLGGRSAPASPAPSASPASSATGSFADPVRDAATDGWAGPIAVVGSGPNVPFPQSNSGLWSEVCSHGLLISEYPPDAEPLAFRFPQRNRIIAALSEVLVVVESRETGGSLLTVGEAIRRQVDVMAVPGAPSARSSKGTNRIIADGARPVLDPSDVLIALGLDTRRQGELAFDPRLQPSSGDAALLDSVGDDVVSFDEVVVRSGWEIREVALAVGRLEATGWLHQAGGWISALPLPVPGLQRGSNDAC